ncbi:MAG: ABC transporter substrate-binding protein [Defluviitaleaceae bacterium]|nr:ABC transporter substrate-binding protein [Defluviitaleaceae bacterium]
MKKFLLLIAMIATAALSGCGGSSETQTSNELTIAVGDMFADGFFEEAARRFEEKHDGRYTVTFVTVGDARSYSQIMNTALMSGRGEDIIFASRLTWQRLADAGRLVDMNNKIDFPPGEFYQSILDAYLYNGGRYVVPLIFNIETFRLNSDVAFETNPNRFTIEDVITLAHAYPHLEIFHSPMGMSATTFAYRIFELYFDEFIDLPNRTANVDNEKFINLLESIQPIADRMMVTSWTTPPIIIETILHNIVMNVEGIEDYTGFNVMTNSRGEGLANARNHMAINANSQNQELAARFIQFLLSYEMQTSPEIWATPVNRNAAETNSRAMLESQRALGFMPEGVDFETNLAVFNSLADRLSVAGTSDPFIGDFVRDEMTRFFDGEVTAEQAAQNLQARLTTYLNE